MSRGEGPVVDLALSDLPAFRTENDRCVVAVGAPWSGAFRGVVERLSGVLDGVEGVAGGRIDLDDPGAELAPLELSTHPVCLFYRDGRRQSVLTGVPPADRLREHVRTLTTG